MLKQQIAICYCDILFVAFLVLLLPQKDSFLHVIMHDDIFLLK